jgi:transposase
MLTSGVVLLHENARPHTAARTRALLEHFNWELFDHPPYRPELTPSDYHLTYVSQPKAFVASNDYHLRRSIYLG